MPFKTLAPELVPLVHHIELAKAGWSLRLTEQLATAAACSSGQTASAADLRFSIEKTIWRAHDGGGRPPRGRHLGQ